ncbi:MAG: hypothetical protein ABI467_15045 [Kofleriaceae bacterium]
MRIILRIPLAIAGVLAAAHAGAQPVSETIALAGSDPVFQAALDEAVAPAGMGVIRAAEVPPPSLGALSAASRELADRLHATATVWLIESPHGVTLVTYDRERDGLLIRELGFALPLSAPHAAEAARIARTMLRALRTSPDVDQPPPRVAEAPKLRAEVAAPAQHRLAVGALVGGRFGAPDGDLAAQLAVAWRPDALGFAVSGELAPSADVTTAAFTGTVVDVAVAAVARWPFELVPGFRVVPVAGVALHTIRLRGALSTDQAIHDRQLDLAARAGAAAMYRVGRDLDIGFSVAIDGLLDRQDYKAATMQVLIIPRFQAMVGVLANFRVL